MKLDPGYIRHVRQSPVRVPSRTEHQHLLRNVSLIVHLGHGVFVFRGCIFRSLKISFLGARYRILVGVASQVVTSLRNNIGTPAP